MFTRFIVYLGVFIVLTSIMFIVEKILRNLDIKYEHIHFSKHNAWVRK
ncbi:MAG: hypothetical protein QMD65_01770 [Patescibacteria group bacterium]|nr:hypothetical protein [Patescibacteria group bacterium]